MGVLGKILASIFGGGLAEQLRLAYQARLAAQNDAERIAAEIEIAGLEARRQVLSHGRCPSCSTTPSWWSGTRFWPLA